MHQRERDKSRGAVNLQQYDWIMMFPSEKEPITMQQSANCDAKPESGNLPELILSAV